MVKSAAIAKMIRTVSLIITIKFSDFATKAAPIRLIKVNMAIILMANIFIKIVSP